MNNKVNGNEQLASYLEVKCNRNTSSKTFDTM